MEIRTVEMLSDSAQEEYSFSRDKLPKQFSYPLKRSILDSALRASSVYERVYSVRYLSLPYDNVVLDAMIVPEGFGHPSVSGRSLVTVRAVGNQERNAAEQLLVAEGLPILCAWLAKSHAEDDAWRALNHSLTIRIISGQLRQQAK